MITMITMIVVTMTIIIIRINWTFASLDNLCPLTFITTATTTLTIIITLTIVITLTIIIILITTWTNLTLQVVTKCFQSDKIEVSTEGLRNVHFRHLEKEEDHHDEDKDCWRFYKGSPQAQW